MFADEDLDDGSSDEEDYDPEQDNNSQPDSKVSAPH